MKNLMMLGLVLFSGYFPAMAQKEEDRSLRIKNGSSISDNIPYIDRFLYPQFISAKVIYMNGAIEEARVNYNMLFNQIQFLDNNNDTLLLAHPEIIRLITVDDDLYYFDKKLGHLLFIAQYKKFSLVKSKRLAYNGTEKYAAYGQYSATSAITTYSSIKTGNGANQKLPGSDKLIFKHKTIYYMRDQNGKIFPMLKPSFNKLYKGHKYKIAQYFSENPPDFDNKEYLLKTLNYCESLEN